MGEPIHINELSQEQLEFTQAGIAGSPNWAQLEKNLSLTEQKECLRCMAMEPDPLPKVQARLREYQLPQHSIIQKR